MIKKLKSFLREKAGGQQGVIVAFVMFVGALVVGIALVLVSGVISRVSPSLNSDDARNAAEVGLANIDDILGNFAAGADTITTCNDGEYIKLDGSGCVVDIDDSPLTTEAVGSYCSYAATKDETKATQDTITSYGVCWEPGSTRKEPSSVVIITADLATGTPGCVAGTGCPGIQIPIGAPCCDTCTPPAVCGAPTQCMNGLLPGTCNPATCLCQ